MLTTRSTPRYSESDHWLSRYPDTLPLPRYCVRVGLEMSNLWIAVVTPLCTSVGVAGSGRSAQRSVAT